MVTEPYNDSFRIGFLNDRRTLVFTHCTLERLDDFDEAREWIALNVNRDGFFYPPSSILRCEDGIEFENSYRPARLFRLTPSHVLRWGSPTPDAARTDASLTMHLVGFMFETWLQFEDWYFDSRVPMRQAGLGADKRTVEQFVSHGFRSWKSWPSSVQKRFLSTLYVFNRAPTYEWEWEHFLMQYMVFDSLFKSAAELKLMPKKLPHKVLITEMCNRFGVPFRLAVVDGIVNLRNELLHESLWEGRRPGDETSQEGHWCQFALQKLNQRLITAILGFQNQFISTDWWVRGRYPFDSPSNSEGLRS